MKTLNHFRNQLARSYGHLSWAQVKNKVRRGELDVSDLVAFCDEANRLYYEHEIEKLKAERGWISVKDRLPENNIDVIVRLDIGTIDTDYLTSTNEFEFFNKRVTHWIPWPEPPRQ